MRMCDYLERQMQEALGPVNKWYCSQYYGCEIQDPECLLRYYIQHGGASHFRQEHLTKFSENVGSSTQTHA